MLQFHALPPLALYIHLPWCVRKCPYCDFNSHPLPEEFPETAYIDALIRDLEQDLPRIWGRRIHSIFMGGGTPSLFSPESLDRLLSALRARLSWAPQMEITLEANPGTVEQGRFTEFRSLGINRLSLGIQSFNDEALKNLGRIHSSQEACQAIAMAHTAGFDNINLDLMFGLPGQTETQALADITTAISFAPSHISHYQLTIEPHTYFYRYPPSLPSEEGIDTWQEACQAQLTHGGYGRYEVSAFAKKGRQCQHNLNYWRFGDYLGIGAGAHGKISDAMENRITRIWKIKHPSAYLTKAGTAEGIGGETILSPQEAAFEFMLNALRLTGGFPSRLFQERVGLPISVVEKALHQAETLELIEWDFQQIRPTEKGLSLLNELLQLFLP
ncbi:oxygen-independent coproporphyrinogen III oxidase [Nitrosococcus halophilus Nc 4]|uniref:Heme chaperone HemW n=1 Tax=Nitrosococcus halophilus (strain Nc4) TaxID=472759 RepID=D5BXF9_NITHN|nr:radical SAM family heme chaperone HemW [Nitrosococcus halophilus]ADE13917.1 oxygen-independent coproporphyrinogen III oxidase [Nitrosococcus halophilus Nc 4]